MFISNSENDEYFLAFQGFVARSTKRQVDRMAERQQKKNQWPTPVLFKILFCCGKLLLVRFFYIIFSIAQMLTIIIQY